MESALMVYPKPVIRHAVSVFDWENEAFASCFSLRLDVARYAFG